MWLLAYTFTFYDIPLYVYLSILNQYIQVSEPSGQLWNQHQLQPSFRKMQIPVKQPFFMPAQDPLKLFENPLQPVPLQPPQTSSLDKKMTFPDPVKDFYWESAYRMTDNQSMMSHQVAGDRPIKRQAGVFCPDQDNGSRIPSFEVWHSGIIQFNPNNFSKGGPRC